MAAHSQPSTIVARLYGPDKSGLVAGVSNWILQNGGNILHADQHRDAEANVFFQRIEWEAPDADLAQQAEGFRTFANKELGMHASVALSHEKPRVTLFVSKQSHCFHDIILRFQSGEMPGELVNIIANHPDLESEAQHYGIPFHYIPITKNNKPAAEAQQLDILHEHNTQLVVLARYMQILSDDFLARAGCPIINIHHSFLPAFIGAKPYHQAYTRGVKLIGATAHYATADLDEGPIIAQETAPVSHRHAVSDLIRRGRDLEKTVLAQAVRWHLENRILVYNNKTVVFD